MASHLTCSPSKVPHPCLASTISSLTTSRSHNTLHSVLECIDFKGRNVGGMGRMLRVRSTILCCFSFALLMGWSVGCSPPVQPGEAPRTDGGTAIADQVATQETIAKTGCKSRVDCRDPLFPTCQNGRCVRNAQFECRSDRDCNNPNRPKCTNGRCEAIPPECSTNQNCKSNKPVCSKGICGPCTGNVDCVNPLLPLCRNGECVRSVQPQCRSDKDCNAPGKLVCSNGVCVARPPTCKSNTDCKEPTPVCSNGTCLPKPTPCRVNFDCKDPTPICSGGRCVPRPTPCKSDRDCKAPTPICSRGVCTPDSSSYRCTTPNRFDRGCQSRRLPYYCDGKTRTCVACIAVTINPSIPYDQGCNRSKPRCDKTTRRCVLCKADSDCVASGYAKNARCDTKTNTCFECSKNTDCNPGAVCNAATKKCIKGCFTTKDCPQGKVCGDYNQCVDCSSKSPRCTSGFVCHIKLNRCVECVKDSDCKSGSTCDTSLNRCLTPTGRTQCLPCTKAGTQAECATGYKCIDAPLGYRASRKEKVCLKACKSNLDCGPGDTCCTSNNPYCNTRYLPGMEGVCYPRYTTGGTLTEGNVSYRSCKAVLTQGNPCTVSGRAATCGHGPQHTTGNANGDAICNAISRTCQLPCRRLSSNPNIDCRKGYSCKCPKGHTLRGTLCYNAAKRYTLPRCIQ